MSGDVDSCLSYSAVMENVGVAVGIASIAIPVSEMQSTSGLESAMLKILQIKIFRRHRLSPFAESFPTSHYVPKNSK